jgi:hypothetical protein
MFPELDLSDPKVTAKAVAKLRTFMQHEDSEVVIPVQTPGFAATCLACLRIPCTTGTMETLVTANSGAML